MVVSAFLCPFVGAIQDRREGEVQRPIFRQGLGHCRYGRWLGP